jgi:glycosyltransferase involved in cell wall biosynthesis
VAEPPREARLASSWRVSVVIPCHNYGRFIGEALASVDAQTRRPDEIIVCDDGSTDDSWETIQALIGARPDTTAYRHPIAWGLVRTLNELIPRASGDIVIPFSSDDRLGPDYVRAVESAMWENGWDFAYSDYRCFGAEDDFVRVPDLDVDALARQNYITGSAAIRRSLFERVGGYREAFDRVGFEDYDFWISAVELGARGGRAPGALLEWRRHPGGSRNTATRTDRLKLRMLLLWHHPRFFLHVRTLKAVADWSKRWRRGD